MVIHEWICDPSSLSIEDIYEFTAIALEHKLKVRIVQSEAIGASVVLYDGTGKESDSELIGAMLEMGHPVY